MSFWGDLTGSSQQSDIANANKKANAALDTGYQGQQAAYGQAAANYSPYTQTGGQANTFYANALGLNGDDARNSAESTITSDPLWSGKLGLDTNNVYKGLNARGLNGSGMAALAGQRTMLEDYNSTLDRYGALGSQGLSAAGQQAGVYQGEGNNAFNYGSTKAGNDINYGNALAQSRSIGINNILGGISAATGAYNAFANPGANLVKPKTGNQIAGGY